MNTARQALSSLTSMLPSCAPIVSITRSQSIWWYRLLTFCTLGTDNKLGRHARNNKPSSRILWLTFIITATFKVYRNFQVGFCWLTNVVKTRCKWSFNSFFPRTFFRTWYSSHLYFNLQYLLHVFCVENRNCMGLCQPFLLI